jgi:catechol 2,3-dioxygenase-like lactoylglutathione lyase family enzyme
MDDKKDNPIRIVKIGHIGLFCRDVKKMIDFYTRILGCEISDVNDKGMVFLRFGADHHSLVLAPMPETEMAKGQGGTVVQQIALEVADLDALKKIRKYLTANGVEMKSKLKHEGPGGNYTFDFDDPEGNHLQFFSDMDQIGWDGAIRPRDQWQRYEIED